MSSGKPDWYKSVTMTGWDGSDYLPVLLDPQGQLFALIKGRSGTEYVSVKLDPDGQLYALIAGQEVNVGTITEMLDKDRDIRGLDGATKRPVAVDTSGIMLARMKGSYSGLLKDVNLDDSGNIIALMKGVYNAVLKTIAVDANGVMKANLSAQDLQYLKVRPVYGQGIRDWSGPVTVQPTTKTIMHLINGRGAVIGGMGRLSHGAYPGTFQIEIWVDGPLFFSEAQTELAAFYPTRSGAQPVSMSLAIDETGVYTWNYNPFTTFETKLEITIYSYAAVNITIYSTLNYALVPS